jgi:hypothetical protein
MRCPACGHKFANPTAQAGGRAGGAARVAKGFASPAVQAKALATRRRKARAGICPNATSTNACMPCCAGSNTRAVDTTGGRASDTRGGEI